MKASVATSTRLQFGNTGARGALPGSETLRMDIQQAKPAYSFAMRSRPSFVPPGKTVPPALSRI